MGPLKDEGSGGGQEDTGGILEVQGRSHLEMACNVWSSSISGAQRRSLDRAQQVTMAAIVGFWPPPLTDQLSELGLEQLASRKDKVCPRFAHTTGTRSRHQDIITVASTNPERSGKHFLKYKDRG